MNNEPKTETRLLTLSQSTFSSAKNGETKFEIKARNVTRFERQHGIYGNGNSGVVQRLPQGLPLGKSHRRRVQENLREFLPVRRRLQVRRTRL